MSYTVACVECPDYQGETVRAAVGRAVRLAGGLDEVVQPDDRVLVKMNHLGEYPSERAISTHPEVVAAMVAHLRGHTDHVVVGDGLTRPGNDEFLASGTAQVASRDGFQLVNFLGNPYRRVPLDGGARLRSVPLAEAVTTADASVTVAKLKTHVLTLMTAAVKNGYGYLPKRARENYHRSYIVPREFAEVVVDIYQACPPGFSVVDAVVGLEGYGPASKGSPRRVGCILAGRNAVAVDCVAAHLMGMSPRSVDTIVSAARRGLGPSRLRDINLVGDDIRRFVVPDYAKPESAMRFTEIVNRLPESVARVLTQVTEYTRGVPLASGDLCTSCGRCAAHCPVNAIRFAGGRAVMDYSLCIRCFCCQEFCPEGAIEVNHGPSAYLWRGLKCIVRGIRRILRSMSS